MSNQELPTIDPAALAQVSGGTTVATGTASSSSDQVLTALTGILSSIQSLAQQHGGGGFNQQEMLMLMMIMQQRNQQQVAVASANPWGGWGQTPIVYY
ncbi:MAG TPA: hypothetical protein VF469_36100 [Kofleriaceae bacterium]